MPDGIPEGGQILLTVYEDVELVEGVEAGRALRSEDRYEVATREPAGLGIRVWSPPLELEAKG